MQRRAVCLVSGIYPPDIGGPAKFTVVYNEWLRNLNYETSIITLTNSSDIYVVENSTPIKKISRNRNLFFRYLICAFHISREFRLGKTILANGMFIETLIANFISKGKYVAKVPGDIVWERARNSGFTSVSAQEFQNLKLPIKYKFFRQLFTFSLNRASSVIVPSKYLMDFCLGWGVKSSKIKLIHNAISIEKFPYNPDSEKYIDVLCVSRLTNLKGLPEVIEVCKKLDLNLTIAGTGPEFENLRNLAQKLNANVTFLGDVSQSDLPKLYSSAKLFILNSQFESTSYSLLEARAVGVFTISNLGTGSEEVISHMVDGLLCGNNNQMTLEQAIKIANSESSFRESAVKKAREETEKNYDLELTYKKILEIL